MQRSIATAPGTTPAAAGSPERPLDRHDALPRYLDPAWIGFAFVAVALVVYVLSHLDRSNFYNHFVWQADAFLRGDVAIPYPSDRGAFGNGYFQDVMPLDRAHGVKVERPGYALLPFPPLPAIILLPFVAVTGLATDMSLFSMIVGAINVGLAWRLTSRLTDRLEVAFLATVFFGFGTVAWYAAMLGSTWFFAHTVATTFLLLAITRALDGEREEAVERLARAGEGGVDWPPTVRSLLASARRGPVAFVRELRAFLVGSQFRAGLLFGLAGTARLTVMFGASFFMLVGGGGSVARRALSAGLGAAIPIGLLLAYNVATTGHLFHPAYDYLYRTEYTPREEFRHVEWGIEDPRYIPQNSVIALLWPPQVKPPHPDADKGKVCTNYDLLALEEDCPILKPDPIGMSLLLTSPAYLLVAPLLLAAWRRRIVLGAALATGAVALINVMHFSQGWVQFGYRFSNDYAPFALVLVTLAIAKVGLRRTTWALVIASVLINAWGVYWGIRLGW